MFQAYSAIFRMLYIQRHICPHSGMFRQIQVYLESWHRQTYSFILRYIRTHGLFRHIQNHRHIYPISGTLFRDYSGAIYVHSEPYLGKFRHILVSGLFRHGMFHVYSCISYTYRGIFAHIRVYFNRFMHIQDPCLTGANSVNQHLLLRSGSSFKSLFKSI